MPAPRLREQFEDLDKQGHAVRLGMWAFLGSELLLFSGLIALYAGYRAMYPVDFELAVAHNNVVIGTVNTLVLITSSLTVATALQALHVGRARVASALLAVSIGCGLLFLLLKGVEYRQHFHEGIFPGDHYRFAGLPTHGGNLFFTLYFMLTFLHALHVTAGLGFLGVLALGCWRGRFSAAHDTPVELGGLYWHLIDVVWIFLWPMLYLMHR